MKKKIAILALSLMTASGLSAQLEDISITTSVAWESSYVFRGFELSEETFFPSIEITSGNYYAGIWAAMPFDTVVQTQTTEGTTREFERFNDEVDFYGGYTMPLDLGGEMVTLDFGGTYYTYPDAADIFVNGQDNTFEVYVGITADEMMASPSLYFYYDTEIESYTLEGSVSYSMEVREDLTFDVSGTLGHVEYTDGNIVIQQANSVSFFDGYTYASVTAGGTYSLAETMSASAWVSLGGSTEDTYIQGDLGPDDSGWWVGFSVDAFF